METVQPESSPENAPHAQNMVNNFPYDERLSVWEISQLWLFYQTSSLRKCIFQYVIAQTQDPDMKAFYLDTLNTINAQLSTMTNLFLSADFSVPQGFTDKDVEPNAKRLFSDSLTLNFFRMMNRFRFVKLAHLLPLIIRPDLQEFFNSALVSEQNLMNRSKNLAIKKGIHTKPPYTPVSDKVNFISNQTWYGEFFKKGRSINVLELTHVFLQLDTKQIQRAIRLGFCQVVKDPKVKAFMIKGLDILDKVIERWSIILNKEDLPLPISWECEVTDSLDSPFSDKLMLYQILLMITYSVYDNGFSLANCNRKDIVAAFAKAELEQIPYGKDALDLMIANGWMEEIPLIIDRKKMIGLI
ncbi:MAG: DUF3231 family protein [Desulfitobacteriaceae bacterium]|nr:DUF3231 family protein [Desulfitobacteriaceae bacterium]MDD4346286.1 DUF3231 family protein [Desulfitobacteriaceae bacterium]